MSEQSYDLKEKKCEKCNKLKQVWEIGMTKFGIICEDCLVRLNERMFRKDIFKKISLTLVILSVMLLVGSKIYQQQDNSKKTERKDLILKT